MLNFKKYIFKLIVLPLFVSMYSVADWIIGKITKKRRLIKKKIEYEGQNILLLALYEKGALREDVKNLLIKAKEHGLYIIGVNTQSLSNDDFDFFDYYVEKENFGRDFGSYKTGFEYIYQEKINQKCKRLIMMNDSVYYSSKNLNAFLDSLINTPFEVLGATENNEFEYHLGSFCISFSDEIVNNNRFIKFWSNYRLSDVRPKVIKNGELALSRCLKKIITSNNQISSLYNAISLNKICENNELTLSDLLQCAVEGVHKRNDFNLASLVKNDVMIKNFFEYHSGFGKKNKNVLKLSSILEDDNVFDLKDFNVIKEILISKCLSSFTVGSQIHYNCILLLKMGCPIIKLDLLHRGVCSLYDIKKMANFLDESEKEQFLKIMLSKPYILNQIRTVDLLKYYTGIL